jgi:hypothetical protein
MKTFLCKNLILERSLDGTVFMMGQPILRQIILISIFAGLDKDDRAKRMLREMLKTLGEHPVPISLLLAIAL